MNRKLGVIIICFLAVGLFLVGCSSTKNTSDKKVAPQVSAIKAIKGTLDDTTTVSGKLEAFASADVVPKTSGKVNKITVDIGSEVREGDLLLALDAPELQAAVNQAQANLQKAKDSDMSTLKNTAISNLEAAETSYKNAETEFNRVKQLFNEGAVSQQSFDLAEKTYLLAQSTYEAAKRNMDIVVNGTVPNTIKVSEAQLAQARANYANMITTAPISGVVTAKNVNVGEKTPSDKPAITIVNLDKVVVHASVNEDRVNSLKVGQKVPVLISAVSDTPFQADITNISYAADSTTKAYPVKIQINNANHKLKPGMFAEVKLEGSKDEYLLVPRGAILKTDQTSFVFAIEGKKISRKEVTTGRSDGKNIVILSGLKGGENVVSSGVDALRDGMEVAVENQR